MNKARLYYVIAAVIIGFSMFMAFGVTGEGGVATYYLTVALTFPIGLLVGYGCSLLSEVFNPNIVGLFFIPIAAIANYFQWVFFISIYRKRKQKKREEFVLSKAGGSASLKAHDEA